MRIKWLHLSDIHFNSNNYDSINLRKRLIKYLGEMEIKFNFVAITGDISWQNNGNKAYGEDMVEFIKKILISVHVDVDNLFVVPGNHDLNRKNFNREMFIKGIKNCNDKFDKMNSIPDKNLQDLKDDHKYFYEFLNKIYNDTHPAFNQIHYAVERESFNVLNLNTCLSYTEEFQDKLLICQTKLPERIDDWDDERKLNIAIGHHGFDFMEDTQKEKLMHKFSDSGIDIYLCGHIHKPDFEKIYDTNDTSVFVSGCNFVNQKSTPSFIVYDVDLDTGKGNAYLHVWDNDEDLWKSGYTRKYRDGIREFEITRLKKMRQLQETKSETAITGEFNSINNYKEINDYNQFQTIYLHNNINEIKDKKTDMHRNLIEIVENMYKLRSYNYEMNNYDNNLTQSENKLFLMKYIDLLNKNTLHMIEKSTYSSEIITNYRQLLTIGNRMILFLQNYYHYDLNFTVLDKINDLNSNVSTQNELINEFLLLISRWIRGLFIILYPEHGEITLNEIAIELNLMQISNTNQNQIDKSLKQNELEKCCFATICNTNMYENSCTLPDGRFNQIIEKGLITLVYSIYKNRGKIIEKTKELIVNKIDNEDTLILLRMISDEQRKYLKQFKGREEYVNDIIKKIDETHNSLLVIHGKEQIGKSSILFKAIDEMSDKKCAVGEYANDINECAPWITTVIYHSGKQSNDIYEMIKSITYQANTRLIDKVNISRLQLRNKIVYKRIIQDILDRLVTECGKAILILDGVDQLIKEMDDLDFLPESVPNGSSILVSTRSNANILRWFKDKRNAEFIEIKEISRGSIPLFTGIEDSSIKPENIKFNDEVYDNYSDKPSKIIEIGKKVDHNNNDFSVIKFDIADEKEMYLELCEKWTDDNKEDKEIFQEMLLLLSFFNPICCFDIEWIQLYFRSRDINYKLPYYRRLLFRVEDQVEEVDFKKIRLSNRAFSDYVINFYFSKIDIEEFVNNIFSWFLNDKSIPVKLICLFIQYWSYINKLKKGVFTDAVDNFLNGLLKLKDSKLLYNIANTILDEGLKMDNLEIKCLDLCLNLDDPKIKLSYAKKLIKGNYIPKDADKGEKILRQLVSEEDVEAQYILGRMLILGDYLNKNVHEGEMLLVKSSQQGFIDAQVLLGTIYLEGDELPKNNDKAYDYLNDAVKMGNNWAKLILGNSLIIGFGKYQDLSMGEKLLRDSADCGNKKAKEILANRLIDGIGISMNPSEGKRLLRELIETGSVEAKINLANRYLDGLGIEQNIEEGEKILVGMVNSGEVDAKRNYALRLLDGNIIKQDREKGEKLLRELVQDGDKEAKHILANRLLDGTSIKRNSEEGEKYLIELVDEGYDEAKLDYANRMIDGDGIQVNQKKGMRLLRELVLGGNDDAKIVLAKRLISGDNIEISISEGIKFLRELIEKDNIKAQMELGLYLIDHKSEEHYEGEGEKLLRNSAMNGYSLAKLYLGNSLLEGSDIEQDIDEGEKILRELALNGYNKAALILGNRLIDGDKVKRNREEGEYLLKKSAGLGNSTAKFNLGARMLEGNGLIKDVIKGEELIREAVAQGNVNAKYYLGERLLDGVRINKNIEEGKKLLYESMEQGNIKAKLNIALRLLDGNGLDKNNKTGEQLLREVAKKNNEEAKVIFANRLIGGIGLDKNYNEGINIFREMIKEDNKRARHIFALRLLDGIDIPINKSEGEPLLRENAQSGYIKSKIELASRLIDGNSLNKNVEEGIEIFERLVDEENQEGIYEYAQRLVVGDGVNQDADRGVILLRKLVDQDYTRGKYTLGVLLLDGEHISCDEEQGEKFLREAVSDNYEPAILDLAIRLLNGYKLEVNIQEGECLLRELIKEGNIRAKIELGKFLINRIDTKEYINEGLVILNDIIQNKVANNSYSKDDLLYTYEILCNYYFSLYDDISKIKGFRCLKEAAQLQDSDAILELGIRYIEGNGVNKCVSKGRKKIEKAYEYGNSYAKYEFGRRLKDGIKFIKNEKLGIKYMNEVIEDCDCEKLRSIAFNYYKRKELEVASLLFDKAFEKGSITAGNDLTYMLRRKEAKGNIKNNKIENLLNILLKNNNRISIMNYALCFASGFQKKKDWKKADELISSLTKVYPIVTWWHEISVNGDGEGDLVIGWLLRHKLIYDPDGKSIKQRMDRARSCGWDIPEWMYTNKINS